MRGISTPFLAADLFSDELGDLPRRIKILGEELISRLGGTAGVRTTGRRLAEPYLTDRRSGVAGSPATLATAPPP